MGAIARAAIVLALVAAASACGRILSLRKPPRALLMATELPTWNCNPAGCFASGVLQNVGNGCASQIAGNVYLLDARGQPIESRPFMFPLQQVLDPRDYVEWRIDFVPIPTAQAVARFAVEPRWITTPCNEGAGWFGHRKR